MADEPEVIRDQMQDTRTALTEKLAALEQTVAQTVQNTTSTVTETVQSVKDAVQDTVGTVKDTVAQTVDSVKGAAESTVETVKETFNLPRHIENYPWAAMLGSVAVGYVVGRLLPDTRDVLPSSSSLTSRMAASQEMPGAAYAGQEPRAHNGHHGKPNGAERQKEEAPSGGESLLGGLFDAYHDQLEQLKGLGVAAVVGVVRDLVTQNVQGEIGSRLGEWMNSFTEKLGARPLTEPVLASEPEEEAPAPRMAGSSRKASGRAHGRQVDLS